MEREKKEVAAKSLEALTKMGHKHLKLTEHESPSATFTTGSCEGYSSMSRQPQLPQRLYIQMISM